MAWSRLPLAKYFQSSTSRLATCAAPKSWTFWRGLEPLHEIEEPVLFRHTKNAQGELRKMAFTYSRMGPVCFRLINMADHNRAGKPSILPETRPQNESNCTSRSDFFTSFCPPNQPIFLQRSNRSLEISPFSCVTRRSTRSRVRSRRSSSTALAYAFFLLAMACPNLWL